MRRSSVYYALRYVVQCQPTGQAFFESMCAFNADSVAVDYAKDCYKSAPDGYRYRVIDHRNNEDRVVYRCGHAST